MYQETRRNTEQLSEKKYSRRFVKVKKPKILSLPKDKCYYIPIRKK